MRDLAVPSNPDFETKKTTYFVAALTRVFVLEGGPGVSFFRSLDGQVEYLIRYNSSACQVAGRNFMVRDVDVSTDS